MTRGKCLRTALVLVSLLSTPVVARASSPPPPGVDGHARARRSSVSIRYRSAFGLVFVPVRVNGSRPFWFLLDTGYESSVIDASVAHTLGLPMGNRRAEAAPGGTIDVGDVPGVRLRIGGLATAERTLLVTPLSQLEPIVGRHLHGILGHDVVAEYTVTIDYEKHTVRFEDPEGFTPARHSRSVPVTIIANEPFVDGAILEPDRPPIAGRFKIDTGSLGGIGFNKNYVESNGLLKGRKVIAAPGAAAGGDTSGVLFRVGGFRIDTFTLNDLVAGATLDSKGFENRADAGTIGAEILGRFTVTFDYRRDRMLLEPNGLFAVPIPTELGGVWPVAVGADFKTIQVHAVLAGSPAAEGGLREGDVIEAIDGKSASVLGLEAVWMKFKTGEGSTRRVRVRRDGKRLELSVVLRRLV